MIVAGYWIMLIEAVETVCVYWIVEYKVTYMQHMEIEGHEKKLEEARSFRAVGDQAEILAASLRRRSSRVPTGDDFLVEGHGDDGTASPPRSLEVSPVGSMDAEGFKQSLGPDPELGLGEANGTAAGPGDGGASSPSASAMRGLKKSALFKGIGKHRKAFLASKSEYKTALVIDLVFLVLCSLAFMISTIIFFALSD